MVSNIGNKKILFWIGLFLSFLIIIFLVLFFGKNKTIPLVANQVYVKPLYTHPQSFDPIKINDVVSVDVSKQIYDTLWRYDEAFNLIPHLIEKWQLLNNGTQYWFKLKKGVKFHNGKEVTAIDCKYSIDRVVSSMSLHANRLSNIIGYDEVLSKKTETLRGISIIDRYTFKIELKKRSPDFLNLLTKFYMAILPMNELKKQGNDFFNMPIGSGPFRFIEDNPEGLLISKNDDYFLGEPKLDSIRYVVVSPKDVTDLFVNDFVMDLEYYSFPFDHLKDYKQKKYISVQKLITYLISFNNKIFPLNNIHFRRALIYGFDKQYFIKKLYPDQKPAYGLLPLGALGSNSFGEMYPFDLYKAKQELKQSNIELDAIETLELVTIDFLVDRELFASVISEIYSRLGIKIKVTFLNHEEASKGWLLKNYQMCFFWMGLSEPDPMEMLERFHSKTRKNLVGVDDTELDNLINRLPFLEDKQEKKELYEKADKIIMSQAMLLPIFHWKYTGIFKDYVHNYQVSPLATSIDSFRDVYLDR